MTGIGNISSTSNTQNVNTIETNSKANQPLKEYSYGFQARLKSIKRYLTCGFSSSKRRQIIIKEFANTSIPDISKLKNRSAEVKTALLSSNTLTNQQKLELYAQNRTAIDSYCQTAGIKNPLLGNSSFNDLEKITAHGIYTANFSTADNIETFMNCFKDYLSEEFSAIYQAGISDEEKKSKMEKLCTDLKQMAIIFNKCGFANEEQVIPEKLSQQPIKKQHEKTLECFFKQAISMQKIPRIIMMLNTCQKDLNKNTINELKTQTNLQDINNVFNHIKTLENFEAACAKMELGSILSFSETLSS